MHSISKIRGKMWCENHRRKIEIAVQIIIIVLLCIIIPIIVFQDEYPEGDEPNKLRILDDYRGNGGYFMMFRRVRPVPLIIIYLVGLLLHCLLEFTSQFFKFLQNFYSRREFENLYFNLTSNNTIAIKFTDKTGFVCSELNYSKCKEISDNFLEKIKDNQKICFAKVGLNIHMNEEDYKYFNLCLDRIRVTNITAKPDIRLDNFHEYIMIGRTDHVYKKINIFFFALFTIIGLGEIYKIIYLCYCQAIEFSIDKEVDGLKIKVDSFIREKHPSLFDNRDSFNQKAPGLADADILNVNLKNTKENNNNNKYQYKMHALEEIKNLNEQEDIIQVNNKF